MASTSFKSPTEASFEQEAATAFWKAKNLASNWSEKRIFADVQVIRKSQEKTEKHFKWKWSAILKFRIKIHFISRLSHTKYESHITALLHGHEVSCGSLVGLWEEGISDYYCTDTTADETRLAVAERAMERRMLKISVRDKIKNETIREMSGVQDIVLETRRSKMRWAGHVARMKDNRWTSRIIDWYSSEIRRPRRRPPTRWEDYIKKKGDRWKRLALNRQY